MHTISFITALLFSLFAITHALPEASPDIVPILEARKNGNGGNSTRGNGTNGNSVNKACRTMAKLTKLTNLAANQTKLDAMIASGKINATEVDAIKAKAANATSELQTMQSNTTLVSECAVVDAHQAVLKECKQMTKLTKLADLATNQTAMDALMQKKNLNDTQMAKLQERIANATTKLKTLQGNTTLTDLCTQQAQQKGKSQCLVIPRVWRPQAMITMLTLYRLFF
ncbi:hypothetical protein K491DRAFT_605765 [Lophiostoma macrostomum CBS 122681]|uniref:Uncharacterized protein n=1 Tax=Lophiostoma macrostomum CBS 122681 TaxID=1314788 RepID=A0A6A6SYD0_9PLEO|nr:hypothetical protein K491DRAFT_605765 [Lophiostoma macrostomum CBS 122681]